MRSKIFGLAGYIPYSLSNDAGFILPVFNTFGMDGFFIQSPDIRSINISEFILVQDFSHEEILKVSLTLHAEIGDKLIFGFQDDLGAIAIGDLDSLSGFLQSYLSTGLETSAGLQIAELLGSSEEKKKFRTKMANIVELSTGEHASDNFSHSSVFLNALWDKLVSIVSDGSKLSELVKHKKLILLNADSSLDGIFPLDLQIWLKDEIGVDSYHIADSLERELPIGIFGNKRSDVESVGILQARLNKELHEIHGEPRQEARIARMIRRIMENPGIGRHLIKSYQDRAQFARDATRLIYNNINYFDLSPDEDFIDWLVDRLYTMSYPRQRGVLLYELAIRLGEFPAFADSIARHAQASNAEAVHLAIDAIMERLNDKNAPRRSVTPVRQDYVRGYAYLEGRQRLIPKDII